MEIEYCLTRPKKTKKWKLNLNSIFHCHRKTVGAKVNNVCTLVPTVLRWHGRKEFKCHIHFSFSHGIEKQIWILLFVFRFRLTLKNGFELRISFFVFASLWKTDINISFRFSFSHQFEKRIWISFFVFRFRITLKNGFEFRFSFSHQKNRSEFRLSFWHDFEKRITAPVQSFEAPATPRGWPGHSLCM